MDSNSPDVSFQLEKVSKDIENTKPHTRRDFFKWLGKNATRLAYLSGVGVAATGSDRLTRDERHIIQLSKNAEVNSSNEYYIVKGSNYEKKPLIKDSKAFDITTRNFTESVTDNSLLLSEQDFFENKPYLSSRRLLPTPEFLQNNPLFNKILERSSKIYSDLKGKAGGQFGEFQLPQAVLTAVIENLKYDTVAASKSLFEGISDRVSDGKTDCQEYTMFTAYTLAAMGIKSDVLGYAFGDGIASSHICNVIMIDGTCCVVDTTYSNKIQTLEEYLREHSDIKIRNNEFFVDSVFAGQHFPWEESEWITKENPLIGQGSNYVSSMIDQLQPRHILANKDS